MGLSHQLASCVALALFFCLCEPCLLRILRTVSGKRSSRLQLRGDLGFGR